MLVVRGFRHPEHAILDAGGLGSRPMNARGSRASWNCCHVEYKVPNLPVEDVGRTKAENTTCLVLIAINQTKASEPWCCLEYGWAVRVTYELSDVVIDD